MTSQFSRNSHANASPPSGDPTGSPIATQLWPETWYMMNAVRSLLNIRFLSPSSARFAVVSSTSAIRPATRSKSAALGICFGGRTGRSTRHKP